MLPSLKDLFLMVIVIHQLPKKLPVTLKIVLVKGLFHIRDSSHTLHPQNQLTRFFSWPFSMEEVKGEVRLRAG